MRGAKFACCGSDQSFSDCPARRAGDAHVSLLVKNGEQAKGERVKFQYDFTRLLITNFRECFVFYRDVMGFTPIFGTENDTYADFSTGTLHIALFDKREMAATVGVENLPTQAESQDGVCLVFGVESVDEAREHLEAKGVVLVSAPADRSEWGIRTAHFRDPDGNLIEINQPIEPV